MRTKLRSAALTLVLVCAVAAAADFTWDWRSQEVIGRTDPSLGNTSKLKEPQRAALLDAVIVRLMKPLADSGYSDERIREVALTTRLRFVELAENQPVIMASSLGLEGGCDELVNCPFWIFRRTDDGYVAMLDTVAASYTIQPTNTDGYSDIVTSKHVSAQESRLTLYKYQDGKYVPSGCYVAKFPAPKEGETPEPDIAPCQPENKH